MEETRQTTGPVLSHLTGSSREAEASCSMHLAINFAERPFVSTIARRLHLVRPVCRYEFIVRQVALYECRPVEPVK